MESSSFSKKARAVGNPAHCLVDGCSADLSVCRDYHRRHKVCEAHSKTPKVMIGGREQRFCQQCSRFQSLGEFDEGKRSCRKRLDGHNRRRRKPQPGTTRLVSLSTPQIVGSSVMGYSWPEHEMGNNRQLQQHKYKGVSDGIQQGSMLDSDAALSLLSLPTPPLQLPQTNTIDYNVNGLQEASPATFHFPEMLQQGIHQTLSFMWE